MSTSWGLPGALSAILPCGFEPTLPHRGAKNKEQAASPQQRPQEHGATDLVTDRSAG